MKYIMNALGAVLGAIAAAMFILAIFTLGHNALYMSGLI